ncbi:flagellar hook-basal body protein [Chromobacterium vaccinii]|uniref:flagellar hook-basal body protein n=1 Tax=Chromobacterium vaccinii TaxID=1108595 RepID=UPI000617EE36|nr:flagellar hook-basal body protein [Chromobacterium vaccinii]QND84815.1 Flagellar basal body rod protein FlgG [Chromobacterium vaccinii]QND90046.1 Flagellar basal body rod protein FlgG [Chromobacterium vaccinii]
MSELMSVMAASMQADVNRVNTVAHNMANSNTAGFKRQFTLGGDLQSGPLADTRQGALSRTGSDMDLAIEGAGYFSASENGNSYVSRGGALRLDSRGRLVLTQSGLPLEGEQGEIFLKPGAFRVDDRGQVFQGEQNVARIKLVYPAKDALLEATGNGLYRVRGAMADPKDLGGAGRLRQGFLEMSNVNSTREMVEMMEATRHFESVQKAVQGMDAVWDKALKTLGEF